MPDHGRYPFRLTFDRAPIEWPNGAKLAFYIGLNIEFLHFDREAAGIPTPDVIGNAPREYGARVGLPRMMEIMDRYSMRASVLLISDVCIYQPEIIKEGNKRNWEWLGHGITNGRNIPSYSRDEERGVIHEVKETITRLAGSTPRGWLGPGLAESFDTPDHLAAEGFEYVCDWSGDDQPLAMRVESGRMISMPYHNGINDAQLINRFDYTGPAYLQSVKDQFDVMYKEALSGGGLVMGLPTHPHFIAQPFRLPYFEQALDYISSHEKVWVTTSGEIADWFYEHYYVDPAVAYPELAVGARA